MKRLRNLKRTVLVRRQQSSGVSNDQAKRCRLQQAAYQASIQEGQVGSGRPKRPKQKPPWDFQKNPVAELKSPITIIEADGTKKK